MARARGVFHIDLKVHKVQVTSNLFQLSSKYFSGLFEEGH